MENRIVGVYDNEIKGPLAIIIGGVHGNEKAGVKALDLLFKMLEVEPITNKQFKFSGRLVGIKGNLQALSVDQRYISEDLNRIFLREKIESALLQEHPVDEEAELIGIINEIDRQIEEYQPNEIFVLDLHTTTASGGIFTIVNDTPESIKLGLKLDATVIEGFIKDLHGTVLHYFNEENLNRPCVSLCFESGQHDDKLSVNRCIAASVNFLSAIECVEKFHIETIHEEILNNYANGLPKHCKLIYTYKIDKNENFRMKPGFKNFDRIRKNQILATNKDGCIKAPSDGIMIMPHYQEKGSDGFFLVKDVLGEKIPKKSFL
ncbi:succinylglutamate desuccinylase/aspartoacylase domain-containing protein [Membranihabitans maritimus]|uniref:succinylglutamate desuccinylase/aspartoacylase domain-containing protein n=1 Tax=Membranihabitans maritimus TaxID=2904244 RepID=UPI001F0312CE|nr:succinylglutamate desuccinylase/aspartoacylase family protein [Membranihabitans maritimus]